jgi:outer membrane protein assembly factor BamB
MALLAGLALAEDKKDKLLAQPPLGHQDFVPTPERPVGYRGDGSGIYPGATPPIVFSDKTNVLWATTIPIVEKPGGWSHSPPLVVGKQVFISAEPDSTLCLDADTGKILWRKALGLLQTTTECLAMHSGNDFSTASSDGQALYRLFCGRAANSKASLSLLVSYDLQGGQRWLTEMKMPNGQPLRTDNLASPLLVDGRLVVRLRHSGTADLIAYDAATGKVAWGPAKYKLDELDGNPWGDGTDGGLVSISLGGRAIALTSGGLCIDPRTGRLMGKALAAQSGTGRGYNRLGLDIGRAWSVFNTPVARAQADGSATVVFSGSDKQTFTGDAKSNSLTPTPPDADVTAAPWSEKTFTEGIRVLACRLSLGPDGQVRSEPLWPQPASLVVRESGQLHPHASLCGDRIGLLHVKGQLGVVDLKTGRLLGKDFQPVYPCEYKTAHLKYDLKAPEVLAAMEEYVLDPQMVFGGKGEQSFARMGRTVYARTAVDSRGYLYLANRMHDVFVVELTDDGPKVVQKNVVAQPVCFYSHAAPVPHGRRLYYRTWTKVCCFEEKAR